MKITKEKLKDYLDYGLITAVEQEIILARVTNRDVDDTDRLSVISLLEKNLKDNQERLVEIERQEEELDKKIDDTYKKIKKDADLQSKELADKLYRNLEKAKIEQSKILVDFEHEMDVLDRKIFDHVKKSKVSFENKLIGKIREKIS